MVPRPSEEMTRMIGAVSFSAFAISMFIVAHCVQFLYFSSIYLIDKSLFIMQCSSMISFLAIAVLKDANFVSKIHRKFFVLSLISIAFGLLEFFHGFSYAMDPMNFFHQIENRWYDPKNFQKTQIIQNNLHCCDFQASIIDAVNECHHGFKQPCIRVLMKRNSSSVIICGLTLIIQGVAHLILAYLCTEFAFMTKGATVVNAKPKMSQVL
jgi:hypothetical protein